MEDRVWVSLEGRASAPVLLGFGSFSVGSSPLSVGFSGNDHRKSDLRWSLLSGFCLSDSLSPSRLSLSLSRPLNLSSSPDLSLPLFRPDKEERRRITERGEGLGSWALRVCRVTGHLWFSPSQCFGLFTDSDSLSLLFPPISPSLTLSLCLLCLLD